MADENGDWLTIAEAAHRLGVSKQAIRSRIVRKTLRMKPGKSQNDGLVRVWIGATEPANSTAPDTEPTSAPRLAGDNDTTAALVTELRRQVGRLEQQLADQEQRHREEVRTLRSDLEHERIERRTEAERTATERAMLIEALAQAKAPWWRRLMRR
jgi:hypothetical protein